MIATLPTAADVQADIIRDDLRTAAVHRRSLDAWVERCDALEARLEERNRADLPLNRSLRLELGAVAAALREFGVEVPEFHPELGRTDIQAALDYVFDVLLKPGLQLRAHGWHREHDDVVRAESGEEAAG